MYVVVVSGAYVCAQCTYNLIVNKQDDSSKHLIPIDLAPIKLYQPRQTLYGLVVEEDGLLAATAVATATATGRSYVIQLW